VPTHSDSEVYEFSAPLADGRELRLSDLRGQVLLIVNTASQCGFTPQYEGLQSLHSSLNSRGFSVLGFPCNQFGAQEPGPEAEICAFTQQKFNVSFPLFAKVEVNGPGAHPLFRFLKRSRRGFFGTTSIKWNFTKFLVDRQGRVVSRFGPSTRPESLFSSIDRLLG
jgi:glutathione peroxidase